MAEKATTPQVWVKFERKALDGNTIKLRIQDVPSAKMDEAIEVFKQYFIPAEPLTKAYKRKFGTEYDEATKAEEDKAWIDYLKGSLVTICCPDDNPNVVSEVMAVSVTTLLKRAEYDISNYNYNPKSEVAKKIFEMGIEVHSRYNPFDVFHHVNTYLDDVGITILPKYRGLGICGEFLKARRLQSKSLGAEMTGAWMTSLATQRAAENDGWNTIFELSYAELANQYQLTFDENLPKTIKVMVVET